MRIGLARFPMRDLIDADQFAISCQLPVVRTDDVKGERDDKRTVVGQLGVMPFSMCICVVCQTFHPTCVSLSVCVCVCVYVSDHLFINVTMLPFSFD